MTPVCILDAESNGNRPSAERMGPRLARWHHPVSGLRTDMLCGEVAHRR